MSDSDLCPHRPGFVARPPMDAPPSVEVQQYGSEMVDAFWHGRRIVNPFWRAYVVDRPGVSLIHDGRRLAYRVDAVTVIPGWCPFRFHTAQDVGHAYVHFLTPELPPAVVQRYVGRPWSLIDPDLVSRFHRFGRQVAAGPSSPSHGCEALALAQWILAASLDRLAPDDRAALLGRDAERRRLQPALDLVANQLAEPLALADLANALGVGRAHTIRLFKRILGRTPTQYLLDQRVARAAELLSDPSLDSERIAQRCGFPNRRYLARVFRPRMGCTPSDYRRRLALQRSAGIPAPGRP